MMPTRKKERKEGEERRGERRDLEIIQSRKKDAFRI